VLTGDSKVDLAAAEASQEAAAPGACAAPHPERGLEPVVLHGERCDRMVLAANSMRDAVFHQSLVVDLDVAGQMGQQVADEPQEPVGLADAAQGDLEVGKPPRRFELAPGQ